MGDTYTVECGFYNEGTFIETAPAADLNDCMLNCDGIEGCVVASFQPNNYDCRLLSSDGGRFVHSSFNLAYVAALPSINPITPAPPGASASVLIQNTTTEWWYDANFVLNPSNIDTNIDPNIG